MAWKINYPLYVFPSHNNVFVITNLFAYHHASNSKIFVSTETDPDVYHLVVYRIQYGNGASNNMQITINIDSHQILSSEYEFFSISQQCPLCIVCLNTVNCNQLKIDILVQSFKMSLIDATISSFLLIERTDYAGTKHFIVASRNERKTLSPITWLHSFHEDG